MDAGHREGGLGHVDGCDRGALARHGLRQDPAAAADVEHALPCEPDALVDVMQACRVDVVEWLEVALGIPPAIRQGLEASDLGGVNVGAACFSHACLLQLCDDASLLPGVSRRGCQYA